MSKELIERLEGEIEHLTEDYQALLKRHAAQSSEGGRVLAWLGQWRDHMPPEAVSALQDIVSPVSGRLDPTNEASERRAGPVSKSQERRLDVQFACPNCHENLELTDSNSSLVDTEISPTREHLEDPYVLQLIRALSVQQDEISDWQLLVENLLSSPPDSDDMQEFDRLKHVAVTARVSESDAD